MLLSLLSHYFKPSLSAGIWGRVARCFERCVWRVYAALLFELGQAGQLSARPGGVRPSDSRVRSFHGCAQKASALLRSTAHWWPRSSAMTTPCTDSTFLVVRPFAFFTCTLSASMRGLAYLCRCYADARCLQPCRAPHGRPTPLLTDFAYGRPLSVRRP